MSGNKTIESDPDSDMAAVTQPAKAAQVRDVQVSPPQLPPWSRRDWIVLLLLLAVAALLRLFNLDYMEFRGDEASSIFLASGIASGKHFPLVGIPSSIGTLNPPLFTYLMAIPMLFSRNPVIAAAFVALINCAAVGWCYVFCRRYFGPITAAFAASCFAVNPWAVYFSRKIWQQELLPLFVIVFIYGLFAVVCKGRRKQLLTCCICLAAATQLHISSIYLLVVLALALVLFRPKIGWAEYAKGIAVIFLSYIPYVVYDLQNRGYNAKIYLDTFRQPAHFHPEALYTPFIYATTMEFMHFVDWPVLDLLLVVLLGTGLIYFFIDLRDRRNVLLLLLFCVPLAFLSVSKIALHGHYFIFLYPIQFVVLGIRVDAMARDLRPGRKLLKYGLAAVLAVLVAYQLQATCKFLTAIAKPEPLAWYGYGEFYGPPFLFRVQQIRELAREGIVDPVEVQKRLLEGKSESEAELYDFNATRYIVQNLNALP